MLTHCTLGVPLKCQARVERLVATGRQTQHTTNMVTLTRHHSKCGDTQTRLASGRGLVWCPDWFPGTSLGSCPDSVPDWFPGTSLGSSLGWLPRLVPGIGVWDCFPDTYPWEPLQTPKFGVSGGFLENPRKPENTRNSGFRSYPPRPPIPALGSGREGSAGRVIPYSIYISQFQTGTPKPRYIGFRDGGRENGTQNGQFRPVFGHILRPLSKPHFFMKISDFSHFSGFPRVCLGFPTVLRKVDFSRNSGVWSIPNRPPRLGGREGVWRG